MNSSAARRSSVHLHEARHCAVSFMHAAGLPLEQIGDYIGHSSAYMTDRYRHVIEGHEDEARTKLDAFFGARRATIARQSTGISAGLDGS